MRNLVVVAAVASLVGGCGVSSPGHGGGGGGGGKGDTGGGAGGTGTGGNGGPTCNQTDPSKDGDGDGFTGAQGDCNDCDPSMNPGAVEIGANGKDDDCNGMIDDNNPACDAASTGSKDPNELAHSMEICDARFFKGATMAGASDVKARN